MRHIRDPSVLLEQDPDLRPGAGLPRVIRVWADRIPWGPVVDPLLPWDRDRPQAPPWGLRLGRVMRVWSQRTPRYPVERWMPSLPGEGFWGPGVRPEAFHDEA